MHTGAYSEVATMEYWVLGEENIGGLPVYRKLAVSEDENLARQIFSALVAGDAYARVILVEVKEVD